MCAYDERGEGSAVRYMRSDGAYGPSKKKILPRGCGFAAWLRGGRSCHARKNGRLTCAATSAQPLDASSARAYALHTSSTRKQTRWNGALRRTNGNSDVIEIMQGYL